MTANNKSMGIINSLELRKQHKVTHKIEVVCKSVFPKVDRNRYSQLCKKYAKEQPDYFFWVFADFPNNNNKNDDKRRQSGKANRSN